MRCASTLFFLPHELAWRQKRDEQGNVVKPHVLEWTCSRCFRLVSETALQPRWSLLARLRRQVPWARERSRMKAEKIA